MTWSISLFFVLLIFVLILMAVTTLQVNDFEKKANGFIDILKQRYDLEKLRAAYIELIEKNKELKKKL